jgi:hypothetical protein
MIGDISALSRVAGIAAICSAVMGGTPPTGAGAPRRMAPTSVHSTEGGSPCLRATKSCGAPMLS